jgi:hypothetical protein
VRKRERRVCLILTISRPFRRRSFFSLCFDVMVSRKEEFATGSSVYQGVVRELPPRRWNAKRGKDAPFVAAERRCFRPVRAGTCHPVVCELFHRFPWGMMKSRFSLVVAL